MIRTDPNKTQVLVVMYNSIESFPPTLNAISEIAPHVKEIVCLSYKKLKNSTWEYPKNVRHIYTNNEDVQKSNKIQVILRYYRFANFIRKTVKSTKPDILLVYDGIALGLLNIAMVDLKKVKYKWYHNHDVFDMDYIKKISFNNLFAIHEKKALNGFDLLTIPSEERMVYFQSYKGRSVVLPNYPRLTKDVKNLPEKNIGKQKPVVVIYQGRISNAHGIENLLDYMAQEPARSIKLKLVGFINKKYKTVLSEKISNLKLQDKVDIIENVPYESLKSITEQCDIGWAVNVPNSIMYATGGKSSNKIYEYMASGLPTIYFDAKTYRESLRDCKWALPTDLTADSIGSNLELILNMYPIMRKSALNDFETKYNFQKIFNTLISSI